MRLAVGAGRGAKVLAALGFGALAAVDTYALSAARSAGSSSGPILADGGAGDGFGPTVGVADPETVELLSAGIGDLLLLAGVLGLPVVLTAGYLLARTLRRAAWLDGRRVAVRGAVLIRTADLARAEVSILDRAAGRRLLVVRDPAAIRPLAVPLYGGGAPLPEYQMNALADAVASGRAADDPGGAVAARLRRLGADPLSV